MKITFLGIVAVLVVARILYLLLNSSDGGFPASSPS